METDREKLEHTIRMLFRSETRIKELECLLEHFVELSIETLGEGRIDEQKQ